MAWRLAKSLVVLRDQVNALVPHRDKSSDGSIGNAEHSARESDHNPDTDGVVKAIDITHDPAHGFDSYAFADMLIRNRDDRIKYVISNRRIGSGTGQNEPAWEWRPYHGKNPHDHHVHISVKRDAAYFDSAAPWKIELSHVPALVADHQTPPPHPLLRRGNNGSEVERLQVLLNSLGWKLTVDGNFGSATELAVRAFQARAGLIVDGEVGGYSWRALQAGLT